MMVLFFGYEGYAFRKETEGVKNACHVVNLLSFLENRDLGRAYRRCPNP